MPNLSRAALLALAVSLTGTSARAEISDELAALVTPDPTAKSPAVLGDPVAPQTEEALMRRQDYYVVLQPVQIVLESVAMTANLRLSYSDNVKGVVRKLRTTGTTADVLDEIAAAMSLDWFTFNGIIYVSSRAEATTRMVRLGDLAPDQAIKALGEAGLPLDRVETRSTSVDNILALSGPPELLAIAEAVIESTPPQAMPREKSDPLRTVLVRRGNAEQMVTLRQR
jgi:hypothetical protein